MKYKWGSHAGETYKPAFNQKKRIGFIFSALISELILPFGLGIYSHNKFIKLNPLYLYK